MIDRIFSASLVFALMAFATATIVSLMVAGPRTTPRQVQFERVVISAQRAAPETVAQTQPVAPVTRSVQ